VLWWNLEENILHMVLHTYLFRPHHVNSKLRRPLAAEQSQRYCVPRLAAFIIDRGKMLRISHTVWNIRNLLSLTAC